MSLPIDKPAWTFYCLTLSTETPHSLDHSLSNLLGLAKNRVFASSTLGAFLLGMIYTKKDFLYGDKSVLSEPLNGATERASNPILYDAE